MSEPAASRPSSVVSALPSSSARFSALGAMLISITAWGFGPMWVRAIDAPYPTIVFWRVMLGIPVMIAVAYALGGAITRHVLRLALGPGVLFAIGMITSFGAFKNTSIVNATIIPAMAPVLVIAGAGVVFGERLSSRQIAFGFVGLVALAVVVFSGGGTKGHGLYGDVLAVIDLLSWAWYMLWSKKVRDAGVHSWSYIAAVFTVMGGVVAPWAFMSSPDGIGILHGSDWVFIAVMVVVSGVIGHGLMTWSIRHLPVSLSSLLGLLSPVISVAAAWLIHEERLNVWQVLGGIGVMAALVMVVRSESVPLTAGSNDQTIVKPLSETCLTAPPGELLS